MLALPVVLRGLENWSSMSHGCLNAVVESLDRAILIRTIDSGGTNQILVLVVTSQVRSMHPKN